MAGLSPQRIAVLIGIPVVLIGCAVFATATIERNTALHSSKQEEQAQSLLTAMLDQETGARGYFETGEAQFLQPWYTGQAHFAGALAQSRSLAGGDAPLQEALNQQAQRSATWRNVTAAEIERLRTTGRRPTSTEAVSQKAAMDDFRALNTLFQTQLSDRRDNALSGATWLAVGVAATLSILLVATGLLLWRRTSRQESRRLRTQRELRELLQVSLSEEESQLLLIHHVERIVPGSAAAVFNRNSSEDRLEPRLTDNVDQTPLRALETQQLKPRSCMAVRLSRAYSSEAKEQALVPCEACGRVAANTLCEPLLVGGEVIGSVLMAKETKLTDSERDRVRNSVVQAAPILANQRNLALAERRAASDVLTGLPNRRSAEETLKRMIAHAGRTVTPIAAILFDLDHFKRVNDLHGHDQGDKALAAIGQIVTTTVRASDFAARYGGEEFLILLPDTARAGAVEVAEKLRRGIERSELESIGTITASFGVAALPEDATDSEYLLRKADRAMYSAKARGRNRVEVAIAGDNGSAERLGQDGFDGLGELPDEPPL
jgi:diguanylate cyclase (GGDEF)-like protein